MSMGAQVGWWQTRARVPGWRGALLKILAKSGDFAQVWLACEPEGSGWWKMQVVGISGLLLIVVGFVCPFWGLYGVV